MHTLSSILILAFVTLLSSCGGAENSELSSLASKTARADHLHSHLVHYLDDHYAEDKGQVWADASLSLKEDWIIQSPEGLWGADPSTLATSLDCSLRNSRCHPDFRRLSCATDNDCEGLTKCEPMLATITTPGEEAARLCIGTADRLINQVYRTMVQAENELDFVSLALPTGRFRKGIVNALAFLSQSERTPKIRMLFSGASAVLPNVLQPPRKALASLVSEIAKITPKAFDLKINLAWLSVGRLSWNHAKIIVADGDLAVTGGHNLWDKDYLGPNPVFDLSMEYRGEAAAASRDFANTLWTKVGNQYAVTQPAGELFEPFSEASKTLSAVKAISLGRLGRLGTNPSDGVLNEMIRLAQHSVWIDQQDLYNQILSPLTQTIVFDSLVNAAARGVNIRVVQSNNFPLVGGYGSVDGDKVYRELVKAATALLVARGIDATLARKAICENFEYAPFRFSKSVDKWPYKDSTVGTHAKLLFVDQAAFYIGSHNLYPANLQEHGMVVTDAKAAGELIAQYWSKVWNESSPRRYACPN